MLTTIIAEWDDGDYSMHLVGSPMDLYWSVDCIGDPHQPRLYWMDGKASILISKNSEHPLQISGRSTEGLPYFRLSNLTKFLAKRYKDKFQLKTLYHLLQKHPEVLWHAKFNEETEEYEYEDAKKTTTEEGIAALVNTYTKNQE